MNFKHYLPLIFLFAAFHGLHAEVSNSPVKGETDIRDIWLSEDKARHLAGGMIATTFSAQIAMRRFNVSHKEAIRYGIGITFSLGIAKEVFDHTSPNNFFSWKDLIANMVGITIGVILLNIQ